MRLKLILLTACVVLPFFSLPALALSCSKPSAIRHLAGLVKLGHKPVLVQGVPIKEIKQTTHTVLDPTESKTLKQTNRGNFTTYIILGTVLGRTPTIPSEIEVNLERECVQNWCGRELRLLRGQLFVLKEENGKLKGGLGPCGGSAHPMPTPAQQQSIKACLFDGKCDQPE